MVGVCHSLACNTSLEDVANPYDPQVMLEAWGILSQRSQRRKPLHPVPWHIASPVWNLGDFQLTVRQGQAPKPAVAAVSGEAAAMPRKRPRKTPTSGRRRAPSSHA